MSEVRYHVSEAVNRPHWNRFKIQGKDRYLAIAYDNTEVKTASGIVIPDRDISQDIPTTAKVVALSKDFDNGPDGKYPDVQIGSNIQVVMNSWYTWTRLGQVYAAGDAEGIIAVYEWDGDAEKEIADAKQEAELKTREALERETQEMIEKAAASADTSTGPGVLIKVPAWH
jgi:co-chaperonin GroES (HSP10)